MLRYSIVENVSLFASLPQGEANRFIRAKILKADGTNFFGGDGYTPLSYISNGIYKSSLVFTMPAGMYKVFFYPFLDSNFTIPDNLYGSEEEGLEIYADAALDISIIEDKLDTLIASTNDAEFEVEIMDDETILEVTVTEDDLEIDVEIEE